MTVRRDLRFHADLFWDGESGAEVNAGRFPGLKLDMPVEFGGKGRYPCPDELFLAAIGGCLLTTFLHFKKKLNVNVAEFEISINGRLRGDTEGYKIAGIEAVISARAKKNDEKGLRRCIRLAKEYCHITRTLGKTVPIEIADRISFVD